MKRRYTETDKKLMKDIGDNLKKILKSKRIQQKELAEITGLSTSAISDYVNGKTLMNPGTVQMIADALKISKGEIDPTYRGTKLDEGNAVLSENQVALIIKQAEELYGVSLHNDPDVLEATKQLIHSLAKMKAAQK